MVQKQKNLFAFIDSQNLNLGVANSIKNKSGMVIYKGWKLDFAKFRRYLSDKYNISKAYLFIGYVPTNEALYTFLRNSGFILIFKPTLKQTINGRRITKGNVDSEIVLYSAAKLIDEYDKAVCVSGDGDFYCLYDYLIEKKKLEKILIPNKYSYSSLLRKFRPYIDYVSNKRKFLEKER
jgi:uncharacterized LabA/DUF88 family protein